MQGEKVSEHSTTDEPMLTFPSQATDMAGFPASFPRRLIDGLRPLVHPDCLSKRWSRLQLKRAHSDSSHRIVIS